MKAAFFRAGISSRLWQGSSEGPHEDSRLRRGGMRASLLLLGLAVTSLALAAVAQAFDAEVPIDVVVSPPDIPSISFATAPTAEVMQALPFL